MLKPWRTLFADRTDAGQQLAARLAAKYYPDPVVLALPRGGVPVAAAVAAALGAPLDVILVRKLGAPLQPELAIGAVVDGSHPETVLNDDIIARLGVPRSYIEAEAARELALIESRRRVWLSDRAPLPLAGRTAILIDDGIATGASMRAALRALSRRGAGRIVAAAPVGPRDALGDFVPPADEVVLLETPEPFDAIGRYYRDFAQVTDAEVSRILADPSAHGRGQPPGSAP